MSLVRGIIVLPSIALPPEAAELIVAVEDVSRADAPAIVVGEMRRRGVRLSPGATLPFEVAVPDDRIDRRRSYSVRVHIDVAGSGEVDKGDLVTTQSYPVLTSGGGGDVRIEVRRV
jgi:putative lipoprotein